MSLDATRMRYVLLLLIGFNLASGSEAAMRYGFVLADQPTAPRYSANPSFSVNSTGGSIDVVRHGPGDYSVLFDGLGAPGGHVQANASGSSDATCTIDSWRQRVDDLAVRLRCHDRAGRGKDTAFTMMALWPPTPATNV